jgi:2-iminobutanoate/2-iminopropanoate deaminase
MTIERINPSTVVKPASAYAQAVVHDASAKRIVVSGQLGLRPDGTLEVGLEAQMERAWLNVFAILASAGFDKGHLIRATIYVTEPGQVAVYRRVRDRVMNGIIAANTYIQVAGLASPDFLVEIEAEAVMA